MRKRRGLLAYLLWFGTLTAAAAVGWWAARAASEPPTIASAETSILTAEVRQGMLGEQMPYGVSASWPTTVQFRSGAGGTVTSMNLDAGSMAERGDVALTVDLRPVVIAEGQVPAFRALQEGDRGEDVAQLRQFLVSEGLLQMGGDTFDIATSEAVRQWQVKLGTDATGRVEHGDLVFVPQLPVPLIPAEGVEVGASVTSGAPLLAAPSAAPALTLSISTEHVNRVAEGTEVIVALPDGQRSLWVDRVELIPDTSQAVAHLRGLDGDPICIGAQCASIVDAGAQRVLPAQVVLVPEVSGAVIPAAAVYSTVSGDSVVRLDSGEEIVVEVMASVEGQSVVSGLKQGQRVHMTVRKQSSDG